MFLHPGEYTPQEATVYTFGREGGIFPALTTSKHQPSASAASFSSEALPGCHFKYSHVKKSHYQIAIFLPQVIGSVLTLSLLLGALTHPSLFGELQLERAEAPAAG